MGVNSEILYLKIEQNTIVFDRHVVLNRIALHYHFFRVSIHNHGI